MTPQFNPSILYRLPALGLESAQVESLAGYIPRLGHEHSLLPYELLKEIIVPVVNEQMMLKNESKRVNRQTTAWFKELSVSLNSLNPNTKLWSIVLQKLTSHPNLDKLTMLVWNKTLSCRALIKPFHDWCSECYEDMHRDNWNVYNPLIWAINGITLCSKHKRKLEQKCFYSDCGCTILALSPRSVIGFCPSCNRWLGGSHRNQVDAFSDDDLKFVTAVENLLIRGQTPNFEPSVGIVGATITKYIEERLNNNANAFAKLVGVNHKTAYLWRDNMQLPTIGNLYKICTAIGTDMADLVAGTTLANISLLPSHLDIPDKSPIKKTYRLFNSHKIEKFLQNSLEDFPPKSMRQLAQSINYDPSFLAKKFPVLARTISERYKAYTQENKRNAENANIKELHTVILKFRKLGVYPSHRQLRIYFNGRFRDPKLREYRLSLLKNHFSKEAGQ